MYAKKWRQIDKFRVHHGDDSGGHSRLQGVQKVKIQS